ncbi:MAG TPA: sugar-binding protein, partial [Lacunisphaera sp.]
MKIRTTGLMVLVGLTLAGWLLASPPGWWAQRGVTTNGTPNDYAAANVGQLKQLAKQAYLEMEAQLPGGAGPEITALINSWSQPPTGGVVRNDFAAVNHGQLKSVAKLFYDRLAQVGDHGAPLTSQQVYPWTADTSDDTSF